MAVPKRKQSKSRSRKRFASTFKHTAPELVTCKQCGVLTVPHKLCKACGYYDGRLVKAKKEKKAKE